VAEIYRPLAPALTLPFVKKTADNILDATQLAGQEIVEKMRVSPETMRRITQPIVEDINTFLEIGNLMWRTCIAEGITPKEFEEKGLIPRPDSLETFMVIMPLGFNPQAAGDTTATLQFHFSSDVEGSCYMKIEDRTVKATLGTAPKPDLTIETPFEVWTDIMTGKADGQKMFMEEKYKATGDLSLLIRMNQLFGS
jgi:hypothetical protein